MFPVFVCFVALIAKVLFLFLAWTVSYTLLEIQKVYKVELDANAEFNGYETLASATGDSLGGGGRFT
jgi:hypothetical protein